MRFALMIEPQQGLTYPEQVRLTQRAESAGFEALYRSDHYQSFPGPEGRETSDAWAVIAGLVRESDRIRHGTLVSPVTFRQPGNMAKVVATIDRMSGGRVELGLGTGWHEDEHRQHGFPFPDVATRAQMLEEQLAIIGGLWGEPDGWSFHGKHYTVDRAVFAPKPIQEPRPPLIVGTRGAPRAIRLAARYADELNLYYAGPDATRRIFRRLDEECLAVGRDPGAVRRSVLLGTVAGRDRMEADGRLGAVMTTFGFHGSPADWTRDRGDVWIMGTPAEAAEIVRRFEASGADRIVFQDFLPSDLAMVDLLGELAGAWARSPGSVGKPRDAAFTAPQ